MAVSFPMSGWVAGHHGGRRACVLVPVSFAAFWTLRPQDGETGRKGSAALAC